MDEIFSFYPKQDFYSLLGCTESSSMEQISTEYKLRARECHPDKITDEDQKTKAEARFMELNRAHEVLSDPEMREVYDHWRRSGLHVSFEQFTAMEKRCRPSMHWVIEKTQPSLADQPTSEPSSLKAQGDHVHGGHLETFRNTDHARHNNLLSEFRSYKL